MTTAPTQCFVRLSSFADLARYVCAFRVHPLRAYSHKYRNTRIISTTMVLSNTLLIFYVPMSKTGRYISYNTSKGKESCDIVESTKAISLYAPIINFESKISPLRTKSKNHTDRLNPVKLGDIGSLARLTYDPDFPDEQDLALFAFKHGRSWVLGYVTSLDVHDIVYQFNYIDLESEPSKPFLKYMGNKGRDPEFADSIGHGFTYLPVIKIKVDHPIFGMRGRSA